MAEPELLLDSNIRLWVVLPIVFITFLVGVIRHYVSILLQSDKKLTLEQVSDSQVLIRSRILRENGKYIPKQSFLMRKFYFNNQEDGFFKKTKRKVVPPSPMTGATLPCLAFTLCPPLLIISLFLQQFSLMSNCCFLLIYLKLSKLSLYDGVIIMSHCLLKHINQYLAWALNQTRVLVSLACAIVIFFLHVYSNMKQMCATLPRIFFPLIEYGA